MGHRAGARLGPMNVDPVMGLVVGGAFAVLLTGVLVWVFLRQARREKNASKR
jgi:hypothetical protein